MELLNNKSVTQKIVIAIILVLLVNFVLTPNFSQAESTGDNLFYDITNIMDVLALTIADVVNNLINKVVFGIDKSYIKLKDNIGGTLLGVGLTILCCLVAAVAFAIAVVATGGGALAVALIAVGLAVAGGATTFIASGQNLDPNLVLPLNAVSPYKIFSNDTILLNVNFFNPPKIEGFYEVKVSANNIVRKAATEEEHKEGVAQGKYPVIDYWDKNGNSSYDDGERITSSLSYGLSTNLSLWYNTIRDVSLVLMLTVLIYISIRIILATTAKEKSKYQDMIMNWVVGICLLFLIHYIMNLSLTLTEKVTNILGDINFQTEEGQSSNATLEGEKTEVTVIIGDKTVIEKIKNQVDDSNSDLSKIISIDRFNEMWMDNNNNSTVDDGDGFLWNTSFAGYARVKAQEVNEDDRFDEIVDKTSWTIIYCLFTYFTVAFLISYIKRLIFLAFLTVLAPIVVLLYPIDKTNDGKAQSLSLWLSDYIYLLLIQPIHLLIYLVLVQSVIQFATNNIIYMCTVLAFMIPSEKYVRKLLHVAGEGANEITGEAGGKMAQDGYKTAAKAAGSSAKMVAKTASSFGKTLDKVTKALKK